MYNHMCPIINVSVNTKAEHENDLKSGDSSEQFIVVWGNKIEQNGGKKCIIAIFWQVLVSAYITVCL